MPPASQLAVFFQGEHVQGEEQQVNRQQGCQRGPDVHEPGALDHDPLQGRAAVEDRHDVGQVAESVGERVDRDQTGEEILRDDNDRDELHDLEFIVGKDRDESPAGDRREGEENHDKHRQGD